MSSDGRGGGGARRRHDVGPAASASEDSIPTLVGLQGPSPAEARSDSREAATAGNGFQVQTLSGEDGGAGSTRDRLKRQVQQLCAFLEVSGQAEELVLRRSGLDGELFSPLSVAIARTPSFLSTLNLNLNVLRSHGARLLATALATQSRLKTLLLFGNQMCDDGVCAVLQSLTSAIALGGRLLELDVGGNCLTGVALGEVASYLRTNTALTELGLSRNPDVLPEDWAPLFEVLALPGCGLARLALEENRLGERGASLAARALASNRSLRALEAEESGLGSLAALTEVLSALQANTGSRLGYLSLDDSVERSDDARRIYRQLQRLTASRGGQVGPDPPPTARRVATGNAAAEGGP
uniref:Tonsoku-like protein n=1 Tax=Petromyzon marinus TaxID=7757 RepID=A0AAJ7WLY9_PETMA|nr:tonsoku-like protein [Petromyzon marinus]